MSDLELRISALETALRTISVLTNVRATDSTNCTDCGSNCTNCAGDELRNVLLPGEESRLNGREIVGRLREHRK